jgi:hypothetical protein
LDTGTSWGRDRCSPHGAHRPGPGRSTVAGPDARIPSRSARGSEVERPIVVALRRRAAGVPGFFLGPGGFSVVTLRDGLTGADAASLIATGTVLVVIHDRALLLRPA